MRRAVAGPLFALLALSCSELSGPEPPGEPLAEPPVFTQVTPAIADVAITARQTVVFTVEAQSPAGRNLRYEFRVQSQVVATTPTFTFTPPDTGRYRVEAAVSDGVQTSTRIWTVVVAIPPNAPPTAVLALDPAAGEAPLAVRVRLTGADPDGSVARYRVEVAGPIAIVLDRAAPIDTMLSLGEGTYGVTAVVEDDRGKRTASSGTIQVDSPRPNMPPVAQLVVRPAAGSAPLDVVVEGSGSDPDGRVVSHALDLDGDGTFDIQSPSSLVQGTRFVQPGHYLIRLRVVDDRGAVDRDSIVVSVSAPEAPSSENAAPSASLTLSTDAGDAPLAVTARATGHDPDGSIAAVAIDFDGDGTADAAAERPELEATYTYATAGTYTVRATVTDDQGKSATATASVVVRPANAAPTGSLTASETTGDAPVTATLGASGTDPDGEIVKWEIDADDEQGFLDVAEAGSRTVVYPFRAAPYRPRLRLTDDEGAQTVIDGPAITVHRPVSADRSSGSATGNPRFDGLAIAPAIWADGSDRLRFTVVVRDHEGNALAGVPVRVTSLRPDLVVYEGTSLGGTVTIALDGTTTDAAGRLSGELTTRTSSRAYRVPVLGAFESFALEVEADAGHGEWRRLPDIDGLNAETIVNGNEWVGEFNVRPSGLVCAGTPIEIHVRAVRRDDAPGGAGPAAGLVTEIRYAVDGSPLAGLRPLPGYESWRTDAAGRIGFRMTTTRADFRTIRAWVDGQPINIMLGLAIQTC